MPVMSRATIICAREKAQIWSTAPIDMMMMPTMNVFFLPKRSPEDTGP